MRDDDARLLDMLLAAREAMTFVDDLTFQEFENNRMAQMAVLKAMEIVGEAASRISSDQRSAHPEIPWSGIIGMRNRLVHGYFSINLERVWETVRRDIPRLVSQIESLAPPEEEP